MAGCAVKMIGFAALVGLLTFASVRFGLRRLPGDIVVDRGGMVLYLPITTSILVSMLLSLVLWLVSR